MVPTVSIDDARGFACRAKNGPLITAVFSPTCCSDYTQDYLCASDEMDQDAGVQGIHPERFRTVLVGVKPPKNRLFVFADTQQSLAHQGAQCWRAHRFGQEAPATLCGLAA